MPITVEITGREAVIAQLQAIGSAARASLVDAVTASAIAVQQRVQEKLAGEVLNERTHRLHDSIAVTSDDGGLSAAIGTDVAYAGVHEFGFSGSENVREHLRRQSVAFGKPIAPVEVLVRAHSRRVDFPERSFLRSALAELQPDIHDRLEAAVSEAVKQ